MTSNPVSLRLLRSLQTILPYSPEGADVVWVVVEDKDEYDAWIASIPGKYNRDRVDRVGGADLEDALDASVEGGRECSGGARSLLDAEDEREGEEGEENGLEEAASMNSAGRAAAAAALLTADMLLWRHRYECDHAGHPRQKPLNPNVSPGKRRRRLPSIKVGCTAKFVACQPIGDRRIYIKWTHAHTGHNVTSLQSVAESRLPRRVRDWIRARVHEGRDWKAIRNLLRLDEKQLTQLEDKAASMAAIPEALRIRRMDVYNELRRQLMSVARKDDDRLGSLRRWAQEVEAEGGIAQVNLDVPCAEGENTWAAFFLTSWQIEMLLLHGQNSIVCMDATHNTCFGFTKQEKVWLYTLVVRSTVTSRGIPVAFMFTNGEHAQPIALWLQALRQHPRLCFQPSHVMIDCSTTEVSAINMAFPSSARPSILFCDWHMLKAMTASSKVKVKGHAGHPRGALRNQDNQRAQKDARDGFMTLMNAEDPAAFAVELAKYLQQWSCCPDWTKYVQETWLPHKARWARAWRREPHRGIDTNNFLESWHNQLKSLYLGMMRKQGVDVLLWFLIRQCVSDLRTNELRVGLGLEACALSKADRSAHQRAHNLSYADALALVSFNEDDGVVTSVLVQSFQLSGQTYQLQLKVDALGDEVELSACPCEAFRIRELPCKHMWLAHRILNLPLAQFSRKLKPAFAARAPPSADPSSSLASARLANARTDADAVVRVRAERDGILHRALQELVSTHCLGQQLRHQMLLPDFRCSRDDASNLVARLEVVRHLMSDIVLGRHLHDRQQP